MAGLLPELAFGFVVWLAMYDDRIAMPACCTIFDGPSHYVTGGIAALSVQRRDRWATKPWRKRERTVNR